MPLRESVTPSGLRGLGFTKNAPPALPCLLLVHNTRSSKKQWIENSRFDKLRILNSLFQGGGGFTKNARPALALLLVMQIDKMENPTRTPQKRS